MLPAWLTAHDAAAALGISRQSLYAYVSRGLVHSDRVPGSPRERRYSGRDVGALLARQHGESAPPELSFGQPVLESRLTLIRDGQLFYRGAAFEELAGAATLAEVAGLLWSDGARPVRWMLGPITPHQRHEDPTLRLASLAASLEENEAGADALAAVRAGEVLLPHGAASLANTAPAEPVAALATGWGLGHAEADAVRVCLIACADHELNVSTFAARCVASAAASPFAAVQAGLAALRGAKHGGSSLRAERMLRELLEPDQPPSWRQRLRERVRSGEDVPGFGHPLYPRGDPRAAAIFDALRRARPGSKALGRADDVAVWEHGRTGRLRNLDFALAAAVHVLELPAGSSLAIFALGRIIGWLVHTIEQYAADELIRPRASYVGRMPEEAR